MAVRILDIRRFEDERGWLRETYNNRAFADLNISDTFVQDIEAFSLKAGTIRGLHFQRPPFAQAKLVRVASGRILDIALDIRNGSPSYGRWISVELGAEEDRQVYIPAGFAHGYLTLEPDTRVLYKVGASYAPDHEGGVNWLDPDLGLPIPNAPVLSGKDRALPFWKEFRSFFDYDGVPLTPLPGCKMGGNEKRFME